MNERKSVLQQIKQLKRKADQECSNVNYLTGYICALSTVEGILAEEQWIPFKFRQADEEEKEAYGANEILDCELPDDDEEILVSCVSRMSRRGYIDIDVFCRDGLECYLESGHEFVTEAVAWMPLPEPYKEEKDV